MAFKYVLREINGNKYYPLPVGNYSGGWDLKNDIVLCRSTFVSQNNHFQLVVSTNADIFISTASSPLYINNIKMQTPLPNHILKHRDLIGVGCGTGVECFGNTNCCILQLLEMVEEVMPLQLELSNVEIDLTGDDSDGDENKYVSSLETANDDGGDKNDMDHDGDESEHDMDKSEETAPTSADENRIRRYKQSFLGDVKNAHIRCKYGCDLPASADEWSINDLNLHHARNHLSEYKLQLQKPKAPIIVKFENLYSTFHQCGLCIAYVECANSSHFKLHHATARSRPQQKWPHVASFKFLKNDNREGYYRGIYVPARLLINHRFVFTGLERVNFYANLQAFVEQRVGAYMHRWAWWEGDSDIMNCTTHRVYMFMTDYGYTFYGGKTVSMLTVRENEHSSTLNDSCAKIIRTQQYSFTCIGYVKKEMGAEKPAKEMYGLFESAFNQFVSKFEHIKVLNKLM